MNLLQLCGPGWHTSPAESCHRMPLRRMPLRRMPLRRAWREPDRPGPQAVWWPPQAVWWRRRPCGGCRNNSL